MSREKWVFRFGNGTAEGSASLLNTLGGKGANLAEMSTLGLSVPPGFTISTDVCNKYYADGQVYPEDLTEQVQTAVNFIENILNLKFGDHKKPLLLSVRSGARVSMPGMMDTILNLGLNEDTLLGLEALTGNSCFVWDSYRRFIQMFGDVVLGVPQELFEEIIDNHKMAMGVSLDTDLENDDWKSVAASFMALVEEETKLPFPTDPQDQLWKAITAVFGSWNNERAKTYRRLNNIPANWGTAVTVQAMVFGNMGNDCATGVAFTRNPSTGENSFYGEYLLNAQGEDVVAGIRTPQPLTIANKCGNGSNFKAMEEVMPKVFSELDETRVVLEKHFRDMQDIEFTIQKGTLWILQTRAGKRAVKASLKIACDLFMEGMISKDEALQRIKPDSLEQILHPTLNPDAPCNVLTRGLAASPGAAVGKIVFSANDAEIAGAKGVSTILVRKETSPDDIHGMHAAQGILTSRGGLTSHAAVVARGMGKPCVSGAGDLRIDYEGKKISINGRELKVGDTLTIDGSTGDVLEGEVAMIKPELTGDFATIMEWTDELRKLEVRTNAETLNDVATAIEFGAEGIGLCRTEHMFFEPNRIAKMRQMILAPGEAERKAALDIIFPMQRNDFIELFRILGARPMAVRLLDPPLHEFLPKTTEEIKEVADLSGISIGEVENRVKELAEVNPMLGHRGCRLGISYPEISEMQARAIFEAAIEVSKELNLKITPEIMIPLISSEEEFNLLRKKIDSVAISVFEEKNYIISYLVGTMIELPRAALQAGNIAKQADFFSFGTNDLTQTTFGLSRDDTSALLKEYVREGILQSDPFISLDVHGVGELVKIATERGRKTNSEIKIGICGEHAGDSASIGFCSSIGLDYVSCSPYRVPIAKLAAARAALVNKFPEQN